MTNTFDLTEGERADAETLALIGAATFLETFADTLRGADIVAHCAVAHSAAAYESMLDGSAVAWLARHRTTGAPIGYALVSKPDLPVETRPTDLELKRIYVLSRWHGKGIGRVLLDASLEQASRDGAARLLLGVYACNERARQFYERSGFAKVGERQFAVGSKTYDDVIYARSLGRDGTYSNAGPSRYCRPA